MNIDFLYLNRQKKKINLLLKKNVNKVLDHQKFILGPEIEILEKKLSDFTKSKYCLTVSSGTDALIIALQSLGIKENDEVITTPFTYVSTVEAICRVGAKPVFVDINKSDCLINTDLIEKYINKKTKAIMPVSLFGMMPNFTKINSLAKKYNLFTIEDAAQSFGAFYDKKSSCNLTTIACTSFFPSKPLGCYGDGGAIFTNQTKLYEKCNILRRHGQHKKKYSYEELGYNARLDTLQASVLITKLVNFKKETVKKKKNKKIYNDNLGQSDHITFLRGNNSSISAEGYYCILAKRRDKLKKFLFRNKIPTMIYYPTPLIRQKIFAKYSRNSSIPIADEVSKKILALPFSAYIKKKEINYVCNQIKKFYTL